MGETLVSLLEKAVEKYGDRIAIKNQLKEGEQYTYPQLKEQALRVSGTLLNRGVRKGDKVSIISENTPQFVFANYGALYTGAASIPVNQDLKPESLYSDYFKLVKPKMILADRKNIEKIRKYANSPIILLEEALNGGPINPEIEIEEEDVSTIIFSSGTSSESDRAFKAVLLSHKNIASNVLAAEPILRIAEDIQGFSQGVYLAGVGKQWHSFEYMIQSTLLHDGCLLHFSDILSFMRGKTAKINPNYMIMIPKVANNIMESINKKIREKSEKKYRLFKWFLEHSNRFNYEHVNNNRLDLLNYFFDFIGDKLFYKKIREEMKKMLGENKPFLIGGSASLPLITQLFFYSIGLPIYQGYGLTETSPVISVNLPKDYRFESSGKPIKGVKVLIAELEHLKKFRQIREAEKGKEGLILIKGKNVFKGYFEDESATLSSFVDGWFNTEDLGYLKEGFVYVKGREKDIICLSTGEKIVPTPIEAYYAGKGIELMLVGNNQQKVGALIKLNERPKEKGLSSLIKTISEELSDSQKKFGISFTQKNIAIVIDFDEHPELMTATLKPRRKLVEKHYAAKIKEICS